MMNEALISEVLKQTPLVALLCIGLYVFYKKDDQRRAEDMKDRAEMKQKISDQEDKIEVLLETNINTMQRIIHENGKIIEANTVTTKRATEIMSCMITELKHSDFYKQHKASKL